MIYNPGNWRGTLSHIGSAQEALAKKMGSVAKKEKNMSHKEILSVAVSDLIG